MWDVHPLSSTASLISGSGNKLEIFSAGNLSLFVKMKLPEKLLQTGVAGKKETGEEKIEEKLKLDLGLKPASNPHFAT